MPDPARAVWLRVANGVESLSGAGSRVWHEPAQTRKALGELLGVFPVTHVQLDLAALVGAGDAPGDWAAFLTRQGNWGELLPELALAVHSAVRAPAVWGLGLPAPATVAAALGDTSERGTLKAGLQLASFLQAFRESHISFVAVDRAEPPQAGDARALTPIFRNSEMYGWRRALCVVDLESSKEQRLGADVVLAADTAVAALCPVWERGEPVGGGLGKEFWGAGEFGVPAPPRFLLYGEVPHGITPRSIVESGRTLRAWMG